MTRPTRVYIDAFALLHNIRHVRQQAPGKKLIAMIKANAYGCGLPSVLPVLEGNVDAFGVACLEEAITVRKLGSHSDCILFQGIFSAEELIAAAHYNFQCVIHHQQQLEWLLATPLPQKIKVWIKVNTGMNRLGFPAHCVYDVLSTLLDCPWIENELGIIGHFACADEPQRSINQIQIHAFNSLDVPENAPNTRYIRSMANSAAILALGESHADAVRPGIMLYGVSPFAGQTGRGLGLIPVMRFQSVISAIHHLPPNSPVGYGGIWLSNEPATIGVVPVGYGDGYPRHIEKDTPVWVNGVMCPIVGRVSMDMLSIDLTHHPQAQLGDTVELWGNHLPVETIAASAKTSPYELLCQVSPRVR
jgi:alanine racemase